MNNLNRRKRIPKIYLRLLGLCFVFLGISIVLYIFFPLISWQIYFAPTFAEQDIAAPIPKISIVSNNSVESLLGQASYDFTTDSTDAQNWFPNFKSQKRTDIDITTFNLSVPKLNIKNAVVSTNDTNLAKHLVNYPGSSVPPEKGNSVIFGHSTLPQLFNKNDYKTIFTNIYTLTPGDEIIVNVLGNEYKYGIENITVVDPDNTSVLEQNYSDSFLTLVTCTPPGTTWKRLVIKARIEANGGNGEGN